MNAYWIVLIVAIIVAAAITFVLAIGRWSNQAMDAIFGKEERTRWVEKKGLDGKKYLLPEGFNTKVRTTAK